MVLQLDRRIPQALGAGRAGRFPTAVGSLGDPASDLARLDWVLTGGQLYGLPVPALGPHPR